jgi:hypothetical protein
VINSRLSSCNLFMIFFLFEQTFVRFMRGRRPQTILTDIDSGLRDAIARELPNTKHVICIWHILSKLSSWFSLPLGSQYADFKPDFDMLCHLESVEDFEHQWNLLVARFGLVSDKHVSLLFSYRASWPLSYTKSLFVARMLTAEFSQSLDSFLKRILSAQTCLQVFFDQVFCLHDHVLFPLSPLPPSSTSQLINCLRFLLDLVDWNCC